MPAKKLSITLYPPSLYANIAARVTGDGRESEAIGPSQVISTDLARYYESLRRARARLRQLLTPDEIAAILDNLNGVWLSENPELTIPAIALNVADGISLSQLDTKWKIDGPELVAKLQSLNFTDLAALADASERFWNRVRTGAPDTDPLAALEDSSAQNGMSSSAEADPTAGAVTD